MSFRIAVCLAGGFLLVTAGCGPAATLSREAAVQAKPKPESDPVLAPVETIDSAEVEAKLTPPTPTLPSEISPTPTLVAMPIPTLTGPPYTYHTIQPGETIGYLAIRYDISIEALVALNHLDSPEAIIQANQQLRVPIEVENVAPTQSLLPDSEVVYGPAYVDFEVAGFIKDQGGYLATYEEYVDGQSMSGAEIVARVAQQFSVGPRLLLALLEHYGQWVSNPTPSEAQLNAPLGPHNPRGEFYRALEFTANRINAGYYGYKRDGFWIFELPDGSLALSATGVNAGTVGLQNILAIHSTQEVWQQELGPTGFMADYRALFGEPETYAIEPLIPITLTQPPLMLPWREGQGFYYTGGPHPAFVDGSAWAAIDFGPPDVLGNCFYSDEPNTAAADGVAVVAKQGEVQLDLDGDGNIQTGWVLLYLHMALDFDSPVQTGQQVTTGDVIGYASCEGGLSSASHLHFARRYNGEWMDAAGPVPLDLAGWVVQPELLPYAGAIKREAEVREPCECWDPDINLIVRLGPE